MKPTIDPFFILRKCESLLLGFEVSASKEVREVCRRSFVVPKHGRQTDGAVAKAQPRELPRLGAGCSEGAPRGGSSKEGGCQGDDASSAAAAVTTAAAASSAASSAIP